MTTPANRAPKFVVIDRTGDVRGEVFTEEDARKNAAFRDLHYSDRAPHLVHPIGPALPAKVAAKSLGQVACNAGSKGMYVDWDAAAAAVIAAHEAGRGAAETVVRWAIRRGDQWGTGIGWGAKEFRALFATRKCATYGRIGDEKVVRITTRRRRVVKS